MGNSQSSFNSGLLFDPGSGFYYAISNDGLGNSTLNSFTLGGAGAFNPLFSLGQGFNNVGLAQMPEVTEPSTFQLAGIGLAFASRLRRRCHLRRQTASR